MEKAIDSFFMVLPCSCERLKDDDRTTEELLSSNPAIVNS